jgi:hypothetical protein
MANWYFFYVEIYESSNRYIIKFINLFAALNYWGVFGTQWNNKKLE